MKQQKHKHKQQTQTQTQTQQTKAKYVRARARNSARAQTTNSPRTRTQKAKRTQHTPCFGLLLFLDASCVLLGKVDFRGHPTVAFIRLDPFSVAEHLHELCLENFHVWTSTRIWTIGPDNVSTLDCDTNFVSQSRSMKLVRIPAFTERCGLLDFKIRPINR